MLYLGCVLFGLGVGNTTSLPGLLVQQEFPKQHFARIVSIVVAINQFSFAFGPSLLGQLENAGGSYSTGLVACLSMEALAAIIVILPTVVSPWENQACGRPVDEQTPLAVCDPTLSGANASPPAHHAFCQNQARLGSNGPQQ